MNNIGIFGVGAIGSLLSKYLIQNDKNKCFFFNRSLKKEIKISFHNRVKVIPLEISKDNNHHLDWLIICLKEYHFEDAIPMLTKLIKANTRVAVFQNGVDLSTRYHRYTKLENILETIIDCPIQRVQSSEFIQFIIPKVTLPKKTISEYFIQLFKGTEMDFEITEGFQEAQWIKLIESSSIGSIQSYTRQPCSIFQNEKYLNEFKILVKEGIEVARSEGVLLSDDLNHQLLTKLKTYSIHKGSSMLSDKLAGNELEINAKIGAIMKVAKRNKVLIPCSQGVYDKIHQ